MTHPLTPAECKKVVTGFLNEHELPFTKLSARTIDFTDLARESRVFVKVFGWEASALGIDLERLAVANGFRVEFDGFPS